MSSIALKELTLELADTKPQVPGFQLDAGTNVETNVEFDVETNVEIDVETNVEFDVEFDVEMVFRRRIRR